MKILLICYIFPPEVAPAGVMVKELAEDLAARGHSVTVQTGWPNHPQGKLFADFRMRFCRTEKMGAFTLQRVAHVIAEKSSATRRASVYGSFALSSLINGLRLPRHDAVFCISTPVLGVWTAWALARIWRARFVNVIFDLWPEAILNAGLISESRMYRALRAADTLNCRWSDSISVLSEGMKREVIARDLPSDKIHVVPYWIDTERIRPQPRLNAWRDENGIAPTRFVALFAGTIGHASGAGVLCEAAKRLRERRDVLILFVGEGALKANLEATAKAERLENVRFLPFQPENRLNEVQATADVGLVTLLENAGKSSLPSKVLGYMAAGRPVVASASLDSDTAHLVNSVPCGVVCPPEDPDALAAAILALADDPERRADLGARARRHVESTFSRTTVVDRYEALIRGNL
ncbi:MAG: glycosyltransferase family 4 protein [Acidobacteria bacterium]|nr:glycosyltransferase family 4 protein [Acidobacteriota bacterium]